MIKKTLYIANDGEVTEYCVQGPCPNFKTVTGQEVTVNLTVPPYGAGDLRWETVLATPPTTF